MTIRLWRHSNPSTTARSPTYWVRSQFSVASAVPWFASGVSIRWTSTAGVHGNRASHSQSAILCSDYAPGATDLRLIAAVSFVSSSFLHIGNSSLSAAFSCAWRALCVRHDLWHSRVVASLAVLLFTPGAAWPLKPLPRSLPISSLPRSYLPTSSVLLRCLRNERWQDWFFHRTHPRDAISSQGVRPYLARTLHPCCFGRLRQAPEDKNCSCSSYAGLIPLIVAALWATVIPLKVSESIQPALNSRPISCNGRCMHSASRTASQ